MTSRTRSLLLQMPDCTLKAKRQQQKQEPRPQRHGSHRSSIKLSPRFKISLGDPAFDPLVDLAFDPTNAAPH